MLRKEKNEVIREQDRKMCALFKGRLCTFLKQLDTLLNNKELGKDVSFLESVAQSVVTIQKHAEEAKTCGEEIGMAAVLVSNFLTHPIDIKGTVKSVTLLNSAEEFLANQTPSADFCHVMMTCMRYSDETKLVMSSLRLIAHEM